MVCKCEEKSENHQEFFKHSIFVKDEDDVSTKPSLILNTLNLHNIKIHRKIITYHSTVGWTCKRKRTPPLQESSLIV